MKFKSDAKCKMPKGHSIRLFRRIYFDFYQITNIYITNLHIHVLSIYGKPSHRKLYSGEAASRTGRPGRQQTKLHHCLPRSPKLESIVPARVGGGGRQPEKVWEPLVYSIDSISRIKILSLIGNFITVPKFYF